MAEGSPTPWLPPPGHGAGDLLARFLRRLPTPVDWSSDRRGVRILDQTLLPAEERYLVLGTVEAVVEAIRNLRVRGAPALGIAGALGLATALYRRVEAGEGGRELVRGFLEDLERLGSSRPTAVNLAAALERLRVAFFRSPAPGPEAAAAVGREAEAILREEREMGFRLAAAGLELLPPQGCTILTHCNTGVLATGGVGTALGPVYLAAALGIPVKVVAGETRPLLQGARLTAWELARSGIPVTVIADGAAGALLARGEANLVLVGADRIAANGDVANKVGTYSLAVLAAHHGIPFYVAAPRSTFDLSCPSGRAIPIEERDPGEVLGAAWAKAPRPWPEAWNPAFDVTPAHLVTAFVTDGGILRPPFFPSISRWLREGTASPANPSVPPLSPGARPGSAGEKS